MARLVASDAHQHKQALACLYKATSRKTACTMGWQVLSAQSHIPVSGFKDASVEWIPTALHEDTGARQLFTGIDTPRDQASSQKIGAKAQLLQQRFQLFLVLSAGCRRRVK